MQTHGLFFPLKKDKDFNCCKNPQNTLIQSHECPPMDHLFLSKSISKVFSHGFWFVFLFVFFKFLTLSLLSILEELYFWVLKNVEIVFQVLSLKLVAELRISKVQ